MSPEDRLEAVKALHSVMPSSSWAPSIRGCEGCADQDLADGEYGLPDWPCPTALLVYTTAEIAQVVFEHTYGPINDTQSRLSINMTAHDADGAVIAKPYEPFILTTGTPVYLNVGSTDGGRLSREHNGDTTFVRGAHPTARRVALHH